ncbi:trypsin-like peptidase domain-containing protein [Kocuria sabuli]|uniref:trypsin-like peptidase domain-containing protein n=1 Tax=Kocuria sabuli TaxID=3071448 RepID=UPI0034D721AE
MAYVWAQNETEEDVVSVGSGLLVGDGVVLTAAHVVPGRRCKVAVLDGEFDAEVLVRSEDPAVDLAVLQLIDAPSVHGLSYAGMNREVIGEITGCRAVGFPHLKGDPQGRRRRVQVGGFVPTAEGDVAVEGQGVVPGLFALKITDSTARDAPEVSDEEFPDEVTSPWSGMSGAVVFTADDRVLGVIRHHSAPEGTGVLALTPVTAIDGLPAEVARQFREALGIVTTPELPLLPSIPVGETNLRHVFAALLLSDDYRIFRGRRDATAQIEQFLAGPGGTLAITAPAGLGKTALLAHLVRSNPERYGYHFFTGRFDQGQWLDEAFFLRSLMEQVEFGQPVALGNEHDLPSLRARFRRFLSTPRLGAAVCVLVDGLDEVQSWKPSDYFGFRMPEGVHVIISFRDTGQDWRAEYRLADADHLPLDGLDELAVKGIFAATGRHASKLIEQPGALRMVMDKAAYTSIGEDSKVAPTVHGADPLYVRFLAEDANTYAYTKSELATTPRGLPGYLDKWWDELEDTAEGMSIGDLLDMLTVAKGPLDRDDLTAVIPNLFFRPDDRRGDHFERKVLPRIRRWVSGNGRVGYWLSHPRLGQHAVNRATQNKSAGLEPARKKLLDHCLAWETNGSRYALAYLPLHLADSDPRGLLNLYTTMPYIEHAVRILGVYRFVSTLQSICQTNLMPDGMAEKLRELLWLFELESHRMRRPPYPVQIPGYVARQTALRAIILDNSLLLNHAQKYLTSLSPGQFIPQWSTDHADPALLRVLADRTAAVLAVAVSPEGSRIVAGSRDGAVCVWDVHTGKQLHVLQGHIGAVVAVAVSKDGSRVVTGGRDGTVYVWDLNTGKQMHALRGHASPVAAVAVTPDGSQVVTGTGNGVVRVWKLIDAQQLHVLHGHTGEVHELVVTTDGSRLITGSLDGTARVWDLDTGKLVHVLYGHADRVAVAVTPDGSRVVTGGGDGTARLWDINSGQQVYALRWHAGEVHVVAVTPDGSRMVTGSRDGTARVWELSSGKQVHVLRGHTNRVSLVAVTPDGSRMVTGSRDGTARVWELSSGKQLRVLRGHADRLTVVAVTPDGSRVVTGSQDGTTRVWELAAPQLPSLTIGHAERVTTLAISPDRSRVVSGSWDRTARVWDLDTGKLVQTLHGHAGPIMALAVTPDGSQVVTGSRDWTARVWDLDTGKLAQTLHGHAGPIMALAVTPDGSQVVTGSQDSTARVWDLRSGKQIHKLEGHVDWVVALAVTPDGSLAVTGSRDSTARVWDLGTGKQIHKLEGHVDWVVALAVTPDGSQVVTGSGDMTGRVWRLDTGRQLHLLQGHAGPVVTVAVTPDGSRVVTGSRDGTGRVWQVGTGRQLHLLQGHASEVHVVAVTPDGSQSITGSWDGTVRVWDLALGTQQQVATIEHAVMCLGLCQQGRGHGVTLGDQSGNLTHFRF